MISEFSQRMQQLHNKFGFTEEQLSILERYTDECLDAATANMDRNGMMLRRPEPKLEDVFGRFETICLCTPRGLREDYKHPEVYWELDIWYKFSGENDKETFRFRDIDYLDVFLGKIRNGSEFIELDCGAIIYTSSIAKIVFSMSQKKEKFMNHPDFFVQVVEKSHEVK
jgi:hypothetical protein